MTVLVLLGLLTGATAVSREPTRRGRNLDNTFPFNEGLVGTTADTDGDTNKRW